MDMKNQTTQWILIGVGALVVIIGGWWIWSRNPQAPAPENTGTTTGTSTGTATGTATGSTNGTATGSTSGGTSSTASMTTASSGESLSVNDQPAGGSVIIASATLVKPSWIAIKDANGWVLGASRFDGTAVANGTVSLLRATEKGKIYYAIIYVDDGDKKFDIKLDAIVTAGGTAVNRSFLAQ